MGKVNTQKKKKSAVIADPSLEKLKKPSFKSSPAAKAVKKGVKRHLQKTPLKELKANGKKEEGDESKKSKKKRKRGEEGADNDDEASKRQRHKQKLAKGQKAYQIADLAKSETDRKTQQDLRTLYVRFKAEKLPSDDREIASIHPGIKHVRIPRQAKKADDVKYAFIEFASEAECEKASKKLSANVDNYFVDFVGEKSKNPKSREALKVKSKSAFKKPVNPLRLFINGIGPDMTVKTLKKLFPKCSGAEIPRKTPGGGERKSNTFGFVDFNHPKEAKAAFDACQDLQVDGHHITVLYARIKNKKKGDKKAKKNDEDAKKEEKETEEESDDDDEEMPNDVDESDEEDDDDDEDQDDDDDDDDEEDEEADDDDEEGDDDDDEEGDDDDDEEADDDDDDED